MSRFNNLRLAHRLGIAFGAMVLALVVIGAVSVSKIDRAGPRRERAERPRRRQPGARPQVKAAVQHASALTVSHLYVHDGDLAAQDAVAAQLAAVRRAGDANVEGLEASADDPALTPLIARLRPPAAASSPRTRRRCAARAHETSARPRTATARATLRPRRSSPAGEAARRPPTP